MEAAMTGRRAILIRGTNWIGDCVLSVPAMRELRKLFPDHHLSLFVRPWVADLFRDQGLVDELMVAEDDSTGLARLLRNAQSIRHFDTAILFPNALRAALMAFLARVPERVGYQTDGRGPLLTRKAAPRIRSLNRHQVYYYLDLLYQTGLSDVDYLNQNGFVPDVHLATPARGLQQARELLASINISAERTLIVLNPGAHYGGAKRWPTDRFAALADRLIEAQQAELVIVGSSSESAIAHKIKEDMRHSPRILTGRTDLPCLMGVLALCRLFVTNDSGPMHLAAALGTPQIALFGSTDEIATGPVSPRARVIHKHVECSPCLLRECPIDLRCFSQIEVDEVYETARLLLGEH